MNSANAQFLQLLSPYELVQFRCKAHTYLGELGFNSAGLSDWALLEKYLEWKSLVGVLADSALKAKQAAAYSRASAAAARAASAPARSASYARSGAGTGQKITKTTMLDLNER